MKQRCQRTTDAEPADICATRHTLPGPLTLLVPSAWLAPPGAPVSTNVRDMQLATIRLEASPDQGAGLRSFYVDTLGFEDADRGGGALASVALGESVLGFVPATKPSDPYYHFALLVPGDRFEAAYAWISRRVALLPDQDTGDALFGFDNWNALACYFHDPAGNIVELISHRGFEPNGRTGDFTAVEILGFSELGLVTADKRVAVARLEEEAGLGVYDGDIDDPARLVFVGERARTLILAPPQRGWLPTGRPAEIHPLEVTVTTGKDALTELEGGQRVLST